MIRFYRSNIVRNNLEIIFLLLIALAFFLANGLVAEFASWVGKNYSEVTLIPAQHTSPYLTAWVVFYEGTFFLPAIVCLLIRYKAGANVAVFQRITLSLMVMVVGGFAVYLLFPTNTIECITASPMVLHDIPGRLMRLVTLDLSGWNSMPVLHVSTAWLFYRIFSKYYYKLWHRLAYQFWMLVMVLATLELRSHLIIDVSLGVIWSEFVFQCVYLSMSTANPSSIGRHFRFRYTPLIALVLLGVLLVVMWFVSVHVGLDDGVEFALM